MRAKKLVATTALCLAVGTSLFGQGKPAPDALRRPGETTFFSFVTRSGKTVALCEGPKGAYLVYRFGTAAKVELQYPAVLDASSWRKFTYFRYTRGGGLANAGRSEYRLSFRNGKVNYELYDMEHAEADKDGDEIYLRDVGITVADGVDISGKNSTVRGSLYLDSEERERVTMSEESF